MPSRCILQVAPRQRYSRVLGREQPNHAVPFLAFARKKIERAENQARIHSFGTNSAIRLVLTTGPNDGVTPLEKMDQTSILGVIYPSSLVQKQTKK